MSRFLLTIVSLLLVGHLISGIETSGNWVYLYDNSGYRYKTLSISSVGEIMGYCSCYFVTRKGHWIYLYDSEGYRYKIMSYSSVGDITGVTEEGFTSKNGAWIYTWNRQGKKIRTRAAR